MTLSPQPAPEQMAVRPRAAWYLLVAVLWVASAVVFGTVIATFIHVIDHGVTPISAAQIVPVPDSGITVYSRTKPVTHDCFLTPPGRVNSPRFEMDGLSYELSATFNGVTVYAVASSPDGLASGLYSVTCQDDRSQLYYGDKIPLRSILIRFGISSLLGLLGLVLLILLLVKRHTSKSRIRAQQLTAAPGYGAGWPPGWSGGPPPSPYGQPAPPQPYGQQYSPPDQYSPPQQYPPYDGQQPPPPQPYPPYDGQQPPPPPQQPYGDGNPQR